MQLVVDTNILISFFRPNPVREFISKSGFFNLQLFSSEYVIEELKKNKSDVLKYSGLNSKQFNEQLDELLSFIKLFPESSCKEFESQAKQLIHDKDVPVFALALKLNCAIWSNEPRFKEQSEIKILSNREMIELFA